MMICIVIKQVLFLFWLFNAYRCFWNFFELEPSCNCQIYLFFHITLLVVKSWRCNLKLVVESNAGEAHSLKVEKILFQGKSDFQNVMVFQVFNAQGWYPYVCLLFLINYMLKHKFLTVVISAVINLWKGSGFGWGDSAYWERWMCIPRNDHSPSTLLNSKSKKGHYILVELPS